jgi:drug/metabolite transporter (DMT)-like permease
MPTRIWIWIAAGVAGLLVFNGSTSLLEQVVEDSRLASAIGVGLGVAAAALIAKAISRRIALRRHMQNR